MPIVITNAIAQSAGKIGTIDEVEFAVRQTLQQLLQGGLRDRYHLDSIGKFIGTVRLLCVKMDQLRGGKDQGVRNTYAVMIEASSYWRDIEQRWIAKNVVTLKSDEREFIVLVVDAGIALIKRSTEAMIVAAWTMMDNQKEARAQLGFDRVTNLPNRDDGKLEILLEHVNG